jgi:hypothetical protein
MNLSLLSVFFMLLLAAYWLHALWRVLASDSGSAQAGFIAAYFALAAMVRYALPASPLIPVWAPFLYPYAWCAIAALFWCATEMRVSCRGVRFNGESPRLSAFLLAQLALFLGVLATMQYTDGRSVLLYLTLPPLMACLGVLLYLLFFYVASHRRDSSVGWSVLLVFSVLTPLAGVAVAERLLPLVLRHF